MAERFYIGKSFNASRSVGRLTEFFDFPQHSARFHNLRMSNDKLWFFKNEKDALLPFVQQGLRLKIMRRKLVFVMRARYEFDYVLS